MPSDTAVAYADDITLTFSDASPAIAYAKMQSLLNDIETWSKVNRLKINCEKCFYIFIMPTSRCKTASLTHTQLTIGNNKLCYVHKMKILGVTITEDLKWHSHHKSICKKINAMTSTVHRIGKCLNVQARKQIIHAFVMPHVKLCITVWGNAGAGCATSLNRSLQKMNRVILRNKNAILNNASHKVTGIAPFNNLVTLSNVCRLHAFIGNVSLEFYTSAG